MHDDDQAGTIRISLLIEKPVIEQDPGINLLKEFDGLGSIRGILGDGESSGR
jgi:hypothetical protein